MKCSRLWWSRCEKAASANAEDSEATVRASSVLAEEAIATAEAAEVMAETAEVTLDTVDETAETVEVAAEPESMDVTAEAAEAQDDAILDMIALEMAADDPTDFDDVADMAQAEVAVAERAPADPVSVAPEPEPEPIMAVVAEPPAVEPSLQPALQVEEEPSLGSSLIVTGNPEPAADRGGRSAGADPAHEPGREDRVLLVERFANRLSRSIARTNPHRHCRPTAR